MIKKASREKARIKKHIRMREHLKGTAERPRLAVYRSNSDMYAQIIDDEAGNTLVAASTVEKDARAALKETDNKEAAAYVGDLIAKRAAEKGISKVVFDRAGYLYHGKVAALAEAAREAGLVF